MPIVRALGEGLAGDRITRIVAILNGTTNAVLSQMEATGCSLDDALRDARARGYAEADPSADLDGDDARAKLAILCALAFGLRVDPAQIETRSSRGDHGRDDFARARRAAGRSARSRMPSTTAPRRALTAWVAPIVVAARSIFARTTGPQNAAVITGAHAGDIGIFGAGRRRRRDGGRDPQRPRRHRARPRGDRARAGADRAGSCRFRCGLSDSNFDF